MVFSSLTNIQVCTSKKHKMSASAAKTLFQTIIGLQFCGVGYHRRCLQILIPVYVSVLMVSFLVSITLGLLLNEPRSFGVTIISICGVLGFPTVPWIYWHSLINYERICSFLDGLHDVVNRNCESKRRAAIPRSCIRQY